MQIKKQIIWKYAVTAACLLLNFTTDAQTWNLVGSAGFCWGETLNPSIAIDASGTPYVVYEDLWASGTANVKKFNGTAWVFVGAEGFSSAVSPDPSIVINASGRLYVVYQDLNFFGDPSVRTFDDTAWNYVDTLAFHNCSNFNSIAIGDSDMLYAVFVVCLGRASVKKYNGSHWVYIGSPLFTANGAYSASIAMDGGTPYVAYEDWANGRKATVMKYNGTSWVNVGIAGFSAGAVTSTAISIGPGGVPFVLYQDSANGSKATVMKYNGSSWVPVGSTGFSAGIARMGLRSLAIDGSGTPYVTYADGAHGNKATVMKFNGSSWVNAGIAGFSAGAVHGPSITIDGAGHPYVVFSDSSNGRKITVMKFSFPSALPGKTDVAEVSFKLFPVPNLGLFTLNISSPTKEEAIITITNMLGEKMKEMRASTNTPTEIQLSVPPGIYIVNTVLGDKSVRAKFVVE